MRTEKRGRKPDPLKHRRTLEIATRYLECLERGLSHEQSISELKQEKWCIDADGSGGVFVDEEVIRAAVQDSRRVCILDDEFRLSKHLRADPEWKEIFSEGFGESNLRREVQRINTNGGKSKK
jgi:hypothetical protein